MYIKSFAGVHPRVIELSRNARAFAFSVGAGSAAPAGRGSIQDSEKDCCAPEVLAIDPESGFAGGFGTGSFGVRRPLRFLAYRLELNESQVSEMAAILDELKTERAQAAVDDRRTLSALADAVSGEVFDERKAAEGASLRKTSAARLSDAVMKALGRIHAVLNPQQRERFAYLIRTGTVLL